MIEKKKVWYLNKCCTKFMALVVSLDPYQLMEELTNMKKDGTGLSKNGFVSNELSKL